ncbi:MAG: cheR methyltransferase, binding domain protein [Micavibrio sp.]|nr:cheR methyltransferase, binding domain protein [Micavibrio sp.]
MWDAPHWLTMKINDYELYHDLLQRNSGLSLPPEKTYLLDSRLTPIARKWGYPTLEGMTLALRGIPDNTLVSEVIEAMTAKDTSFFRDMTPFIALGERILPAIIKAKGRRRELRIWCAGCSTGQEAYSVAMVLKDNEIKLKGWQVEIHATDLSAESLRKARTGNYTQFEVQRGLPISYLMKHFDELDDSWRLKDNVRNLVNFEQMNLLDSYDEVGGFDIILCRNVLGQFEERTRTKILSKLSEALNENGYLLLGLEEKPAPDFTALKPLDGTDGFYGRQDGKYDLPVPKVS